MHYNAICKNGCVKCRIRQDKNNLTGNNRQSITDQEVYAHECLYVHVLHMDIYTVERQILNKKCVASDKRCKFTFTSKKLFKIEKQKDSKPTKQENSIDDRSIKPPMTFRTTVTTNTLVTSTTVGKTRPQINGGTTKNSIRSLRKYSEINRNMTKKFLISDCIVRYYVAKCNMYNSLT